MRGNIDMVWVISFLIVTNLAMGYGLAVYVNRHFGTPALGRPALGRPKSAAPPASQIPVAAEDLPTVSRATVEEMIDSEVAESADPEPIEIGGASTPEVASNEPVDEENVLAGIEEFRSQLAKMNASTADPEEADQVESELVGAAN
jgi:hypothetical protein